MAIINDKDKILQATSQRLEYSPDNYIYFSHPAPVFNVNTSDVASPTSYAITANLAGKLSGTVVWSVVSGTVSTAGQSGNTWTIDYTHLTSDTAVIRASLLFLGVTYTADLTVSKVKAGLPGAAGANGSRTAILDLYKWSSIAPTLFPSGSSTYTWATAQFTSPTTLNGWSQTPGTGAAGQTLYIARQVYADSSTTATSTVTWTTTSALAISKAGDNGSPGENGQRTAFLEVYQWSKTAPTSFPSGSSTYTWATGVFTEPSTANGWSLLPGAAIPGYTLWAASVNFSDSLTTETSQVIWQYSQISSIAETGVGGISGTRTAVLEMYRWSATEPTTFPAGSSTYTWSTQNFTAPATTNGWNLVPGSAVAGQRLWIVRQVYTDSGSTSTTAISWSATKAIATEILGVSGQRAAILEIYLWSATQPTILPSGTSTYTWSTGAFTAPTTPNGWSRAPGAAPSGQKLWAVAVKYTDALATSTTDITWTYSMAYAVGAAGSDAVRIALSNNAHVVPTLADGTGGTFTGATTTASVYIGNTDDSANWTYTTTASGVTITGANTRTVTVTAMSTDTAYVDFSAAKTGYPTQTIRFSLSKSKAGTNGTNGAIGIISRIAYQLVDQASGTPTYTASTSGGTSLPGASWTATAPTLTSADVGKVVWYTYGRYNPNATTLEGVAAATTVWSAPIAASIFQDIKSDNWNGSTPPTYSTPSTWGSTGYYIDRNDGNIYINSGTFRGDIKATGDASFSGVNTSTISVTIGGTAYNVDYSGLGTATSNASSASVVRAGLYGYSNASTSSHNIGVVANAPSITKGFGVYAQGGLRGGVFRTSNTSGIALEAIAASSSSTGLATTGKFQWGSYSINEPAGSTVAFLRNDGTWATNIVTLANTNSGTATVSGSGLNLNGSTSTGIAGAYVATSGSGNTVTWTIQTTSPSDIRLKSDIVDSDLGLSFINKLRPVSYKLKADPKQQKGYGFIAQEVEQIIGNGSSLVYFEPDWRVGEETGFNTIHYPSYIAVLTKAIQELSTKVTSLEQQLQALQK